MNEIMYLTVTHSKKKTRKCHDGWNTGISMDPTELEVDTKSGRTCQICKYKEILQNILIWVSIGGFGEFLDDSQTCCPNSPRFHGCKQSSETGKPRLILQDTLNECFIACTNPQVLSTTPPCVFITLTSRRSCKDYSVSSTT